MLSGKDTTEEYIRQGCWGTVTLVDLFHETCQKTPHAMAVVDPPNRMEFTHGQPQALCYKDLSLAVDRLAAALVNLGVKKGDLVIVQLPNTIEFVITFLASVRIGAITSPVPMQYRAHELLRILQMTEPKAFITTSNIKGFNSLDHLLDIQSSLPTSRRSIILATGDDLPGNVIDLREVLRDDHYHQTLHDYLKSAAPSANDIVTICWTSGTETEPRGIRRHHNHRIWVGSWLRNVCRIDHGDSLLGGFPLATDGGLGGIIVPWIQSGGKLVLHHPLNLPLLLQQIENEKVNFTLLPPVALVRLLSQPELLERARLKSVKRVGCGGVSLPARAIAEFEKRTGVGVVNLFGSSEGITLSSTPEEFPDPDDRARLFSLYGVPGHTQAFPHTEHVATKLIDLETHETIAEPGKPGLLAIKSPGISPEYYKNEALTRAALDADGYFRTGDLFEISDGRDAYRFVGRAKEVINRGGFKIAPAEIEGLILEHPHVAEVAVIGYPDQELGERVCAIVVPKTGSAPTESDVVDFLRSKNIAVYKLPEKVLVRDALPRNSMSKVVKRSLRDELFGSR